MIRPLPALRGFAVAAAAVSLSACISLLPKAEPAILYRFGAAATAPPAAEARGPMFGVARLPTGFPPAAANDQIMTISNGEVAYIADARWVSPAAVLFDEAVVRVFDAAPGPARLVSRGEASRSDFSLKLDVRMFETQYVRGAEAAPDVVVSVRAVMTRNSDRSLMGERLFEVRTPAADNRVSAIVAAYDAAVGQALKDLVLWVNASGASPARPT